MLNKKAAEVRTFTVEFSDKLHAEELLSGTPTVEEVGTSALTISSPELTVSPLMVMGYVFIPTSRGAQFTVEGGVAGTTYTIRITAETDAGQTLINEIQLRVNG